MSHQDIIDDYISSLKALYKANNQQNSIGLLKVISVLHSMQMNSKELQVDGFKRNLTMLDDYERLCAVNKKLKQDIEEIDTLVNSKNKEWDQEIKKRTLTMEELKAQRNQIVHSLRNRIDINNRHLTTYKQDMAIEKKEMDNVIEIEQLNIDQHLQKNAIALEKIKSMYTQERDIDTQVLDQWVNKYEDKVQFSEDLIISLQDQQTVLTSDTLEQEQDILMKSKVIDDYNAYKLKTENAKKLIEMQLTAVLLLQRWWRKRTPKKPEPKLKKKKKKSK